MPVLLPFSFFFSLFYSTIERGASISTSERIRADYKERMSDLEARLEVAIKNSDEDARQQAEKMHNDEMEHLCEQHRLSMGESVSCYLCPYLSALYLPSTSASAFHSSVIHPHIFFPPFVLHAFTQ